MREAIAAHNRRSPGNTRRVTRLLVLEEPPSIDAGEIKKLFRRSGVA